MNGNGQGTGVDPQAAFEALRFQAGQEASRLLAEIAMRDALIAQLQAQLGEATEVKDEAPSPSPS